MTVKQIFNTSAELDYPKVLPTLDLDFANSKTLDPRITFTRASGGSYVGADGLIKYAGVNEARFDHDPETGESLGLLIEESRTNLKIRSEELQFDFGLGGATTISENEIISPDGTQNADGIVSNTNFSNHFKDKGFTSTSGITASQNICCSAFFKKGVGRDVWLQIYAESGNAYHGVQFNFETETLTFRNSDQYTTDGGVTTDYGVIKYPNGWYRLWVAGYPDTTTTGRRYRIRVTDASGSLDFSGDGVSSYVYVWGVQVEIGPSPTSYIPTQASTRTRRKDDAKITGKNVTDFYNINESTILVEFIIRGMFSSGAFNIVLQLGQSPDSLLTTPLTLGENSTNLYDTFVLNGVQYFGFNTILHSYGEKSNYVIALKENDSYRIAKISDRQEDISVNTTVPISKFFPNTLGIGSQFSTGSRQINGTISKITYYPKRLPNSQLQALIS